MQTLRLADIIGPIMVGPSSSHTAGALRIARMARQLCESTPRAVEFKLYGSFAHTYHGHGTDKALVAGMLNIPTDDLRIRDSFELAEAAGMKFAFIPLPDDDCEHPNTVDVVMTDAGGSTTEVRGVSVGGGAAILTRINGIDVTITGENTSLVIRQHDERGVLAHIAQTLANCGVNIATARMYRESRGTLAYTVMEVDGAVTTGAVSLLRANPFINEVRVIPSDTADMLTGEADAEALDRARALDFVDGAHLLAYCAEHSCTIADAYRAREQALAASEGLPDNTDEYLHTVIDVMRASAETPRHERTTSMGGLIGGEAQAIDSMHESGNGICGQQLSRLTARAMAVLETNASMGRIVAAPTAGSAGVIPAVLLTAQCIHDYEDERLVEALLCAAAVGGLIARNATVSGAEGGCQAEIGSAAAMAAAASVSLAGGTPAMCLNAAANALCNMMGLVCDPIGGLVEAPCQKRNAAGAATALVSAEIALAGVDNLVDFDQTVAAMYRVGRSLPFELRESALGGIAATPAACAWCESCK